MENELLTLQELADWFKISRATIDRWRKEGMPCVKLGRGVRFEKQKVLMWIAKNKQK